MGKFITGVVMLCTGLVSIGYFALLVAVAHEVYRGSINHYIEAQAGAVRGK